jgi:N-acetylmuramic acid 6-phosphate etherase
MIERRTEWNHKAAIGLDLLSDQEIVAHLHEAQTEALRAVVPAMPAIADAAGAVAQVLREGGRIVYAGAGSSGLMAMADGLELPGTFGVPPERIVLLMAGGIPTGGDMPGDSEDDAAAAIEAARLLMPGDLVIAVSASGATPYAVTLLREARAAGLATVAIANDADAPIFEDATIAICLPTPPELIAGSTRLGAGTAQKVALNMISTLAGLRLGHVHDGMMVNLRADNAKLRARAAAMVARISGVRWHEAEAALAETEGAVKPAVLICAGAHDRSDAEVLLAVTGGHLRPALARLAARLGPT